MLLAISGPLLLHQINKNIYIFGRVMLYTSVYYVLQSQTVATGYANNKIHKETVKIDV